MSITALDIGTHSIKAVVAKNSSNPNISTAVIIPNKLGLVLPNSEQEVAQFTEMIANLLNDYKLDQTDIRLSLPEYFVANKVIEIPYLTDAELASAISWQAEQHIPIPKNDLSLQYQVIERPAKKTPESKMKVLLVGSRRSITEKINNIFLSLGIEPTVLETQIFSVLRSLNIESTDPETLIVNMGANSTDFAVVSNGIFDFVVSSKNGGQLLSNALAQSFNLDNKSAEEYKINYGLDAKQLEGKLAKVMMPIIDNLSLEIQKSIRFFETNHSGQKIQRIVLSGGPAQLKGLAEEISNKLNKETLLAAPFANAKGQIPDKNQLAYTTCMGLIAREL
jgi:type IV pilus assembly protein PilM